MGANSPLNTGSLHTSVKTGTTDDFRDNWTMGFTRNVQVGVWVGNSDGSPMVNTTGLTGAAPIWNRRWSRPTAAPPKCAAGRSGSSIHKGWQ